MELTSALETSAFTLPGILSPARHASPGLMAQGEKLGVMGIQSPPLLSHLLFRRGEHPGAPPRTPGPNLLFPWLRVVPGQADGGQPGVGDRALVMTCVLICTWLLMGQVTLYTFLDLFGIP